MLKMLLLLLGRPGVKANWTARVNAFQWVMEEMVGRLISKSVKEGGLP